MLDSTEHDHFKCFPVLPGSVYKYNINQSLSQYSALASSGTIIDLGIGISWGKPSLAG